MKLRYLAPLLAFSLTLAAQQTKAPNETTQDKLQLAFKDYQIAAMQANLGDQTAAAAKQKVLDEIGKARKALNLDNTWDYNFNTNVFTQTQVQKPAPVPAPAPAAPTKKP